MPITLNGDTGIQTPMYNGTITANAVTPSVNMKNRIINGAMVISQRNGTSSVTPDNAYTLDRWRLTNTQTGKLTVQQDAGGVTPPVGFTDYLGLTSTSSYSVLTGDTFTINQPIEGFNTADLMWGTANAKTVTLSFWVRSSLTGTFGGAIVNADATRSYPFNYTVNTANTWEYETITIAGDTSGTWNATNSVGVLVRFGLGSGSTYTGTAGTWASANLVQSTGSVSVVGTNGATFYITGVQLEVGSTATSFDYRPIGTELALCQRYYYRIVAGIAGQIFGSGFNQSTTVSGVVVPFPVQMRTAPTSLEQTGTAADYRVNNLATATNCSVVPALSTTSANVSYSTFTVASGLTAGQGIVGSCNNTSAYLGWSAEL